MLLIFTFSVKQEMAYQGANQAQDHQKVLQSTAEVRHVPVETMKTIKTEWVVSLEERLT